MTKIVVKNNNTENFTFFDEPQEFVKLYIVCMFTIILAAFVERNSDVL